MMSSAEKLDGGLAGETDDAAAVGQDAGEAVVFD
jgi:hypothetical protein